jgi:hemolysin activation/secretion protein
VIAPPKPLRFPIALVAIALAGFAHAQTLPNAGSLLQQIERDRQTAPQRPVRPDVAPAPQEMKSAPGVTVTVTRFIFAGNNLLAEDQLAAVVADYLNRPLSFADLQKAAAAIAERYRQAGWVVRAYLPKQEVDQGSVIIQIIEGRFGTTQLDGSEPDHLKVSSALRYIEAGQQPGAPINADAIDRAVMLLDDLPGIAATSTFREGQQEGETDLVLKLADTPIFLGHLEINNTGARSTGPEQLSVTAYLDSPAGFGEQFSANLLKTEGSEYTRLGFTVPVGHDGLRAGINGSRLDFEVISPELRAYDIQGIAETVGLEASYPIIRSRAGNLNLAANFDHKTYENWNSFGPTNDYSVDATTLALYGNAFDGLWGGGANNVSLTFVGGKVDLGGSANQATDAASTQTAGHYRKLKLTFSRNQSVTDDISLYGQYAIQAASKNLDSSEKLQLGGASGVRAYPGGEGSGAEGQTLTLEARLRLPAGFNLTAFHDWGRITAVNRDNTAPSGATLTALNAYSLRGHGLSLSWLTPFSAQLKATWARREGSNPNPTLKSNDQDGSKDVNRFWLSASLPF